MEKQITDLNMHEGLSDKIFRDFFRDSLCETYLLDLKIGKEYEEKKSSIYRIEPRPKKTIDYIKLNNKFAELELQVWNSRIKLNNRRIALITLMEDKGWAEHDISDEMGKTGEHYLSFIGTEKEHKELIKKVIDKELFLTAT